MSLPSAAPSLPPSPNFGEITGAIDRTAPTGGAIKKMWFVHEAEMDLSKFQDVFERIRQENPGVEIISVVEDLAFPHVLNDEGKSEVDSSPEGKKILEKRIRDNGIEFVLASDQEIYDRFRSLRDAELAREIPFGFAGRRYVSVDIPRPSLDPAVLSDPARLPYRKYLEVTEAGGAFSRPPDAGGMQGARMALDQLLSAAESSGHGGAKKDEDMGLMTRLGTKALMHFSGQADDRTTARRRKKAHAMAAYLEDNAVDALVVSDPEVSAVVGLMKRMGYHKSLPVIWKGASAPEDASGINMALKDAGWVRGAPHVVVAAPAHGGKSAALVDALAQAPKLVRLPDNFMEMGGVSVRNFEPVVAEAVRRAVPPNPAAPKGRFDVHFLMTNGNGVKSKGDANAFGHFGMAVTDEKGKSLVWTVQYNDGGSFTGGLGAGSQMSLAEYLYSLWYLPGAAGQAIPLAETAVAGVFDVVLKGAVDEAGLEAMRRVAAYINARHLKGEDNYSFLNKEGMTNCISMVTQILRAAGMAIAETGVQAPADKAVELIDGLSRRLLNNQTGPADVGFVIFERPAHAGPEHYRIANTALGSPFFNRKKTWSYMTWTEKVWRVLTWVPTLVRSFRISRTLDSFAKMATVRVVVGPNSRDLKVVENYDSPILKMREAAAAIGALRASRVPLEEELGRLNTELLKEGGYRDWKPAAEGAAAQASSRLEELRQKHRELEIKLALSLFDEQLAYRVLDYQRLRVADPLGRRAKALDKVRDAHAEVGRYREKIWKENRILSEEEMDELNRLNASVETSLQETRLEILNDLGPLVPHDMNMISRQVSLDTIDRLLDLSRGSGGGKGKESKESGKK